MVRVFHREALPGDHSRAASLSLGVGGYRIAHPGFFLLTTEEGGKRRKFRTMKEAVKVARQIVDAHPVEVVTIYQARMEVTKVDVTSSSEQ